MKSRYCSSTSLSSIHCSVPDDVIAVMREAFALHGQRAGRVFYPNVIAMIVLLLRRSGMCQSGVGKREIALY
ncbi:hypothetical protein [Burkholderia sp. BCC1047]|uniref:hypothetical protein n=1 Tax=Burkholderia sp. BCC1047 TaxID=2676299 RepID=UPI001FC8B3D8|nr:hypothetical protein [Burkholderia sp. BCC1047]